ncbi:hypothetical protein ASPZODRAFT_135492 [Penicilliopsis zonata CBS 506.65]|uniref:Chromosome transmission fidelity protein 8 n=1 Tax=Penicilliopsis zonata CBS 506.65 TaxID=1073090 RepID=A0A1L9SA88_9EURO|nr:hypothetical protein ASPZODRAFT_135492 [Penicilliopsis zonata CBS 506.65]OJJ44046.1 hypothetical protein ASPZODRAFT_135492 [Penicilliopsis zonata CBS 506.65]
MPTVRLHPRPAGTSSAVHPSSNPLPQLLQTPSGLAILEIQGTINIPSPDESSDPDEAIIESSDSSPSVYETPVGKLMFPDYSPQSAEGDTKWMKRVYLYVGRYQRMTGEVKKLGMPLAVIQRRRPEVEAEEGGDELEIVEIVKYKLLFKTRPEPVNDC